MKGSNMDGFTPDDGFVAEDSMSRGQKTLKFLGDIAPVTGAIVGGIPGSIIGGIPGGALGTGFGAAQGKKMQSDLYRGAGISPEITPETAISEQVTQPVIEGAKAGVVDLATAGLMKGVGKVLSPITKNFGNVAKNFLRSTVTVPRQVAKDLGLDRAFEELSKHGIASNIDEMAATADKITGSDGMVSKAVRMAASQIDDTLDMDLPLTAARNIAEQEKGRFIREPTIAKKALDNIRQILSPTAKDISGRSTVEVALDAERKLQDIAASYRSSAFGGLVQSPNKLSDEALYKIYNAAANDLADSIDAMPMSKEIVQKIVNDEDLIASIGTISKRLAEQFKKAKTISDLRSIQRPFVVLKQAINHTRDAQSSAFAQGLGKGTKNLGKYANPLNVIGDVLDAYTPTASNIAGNESVQNLFNLAGKAVTPVVRGAAQVISGSNQ